MFEQSVNDMQSGKYLGDTKVVTELVGQFISDVSSLKIGTIMTSCNRMAYIFSGRDEDYILIPKWNRGNSLMQ
jgi:hypothetical protein